MLFFTRLNEKIDEKMKVMKNQEHVVREASRLLEPETPKKKLIEIDEDFNESVEQESSKDEISDAISQLLSS